MKFVAAFFIVASYMIIKNSALICYHCENHKHSNCEVKSDPHNFMSKNCDSVPEIEKKHGAKSYCYKTERAVLIEANNVSLVYNRGCTIGGGKMDFCLEQYVADPEIKCFLCAGDRCNSGNKLGTTFVFMTVLCTLFLI